MRYTFSFTEVGWVCKGNFSVLQKSTGENLLGPDDSFSFFILIFHLFIFI